MAKIKQIKIGTTAYDVCDVEAQAAAEAAQATADAKVATINGYTYDKINKGEVLFANIAVTTSEIDGAVAALDEA